MEIKNIKIETIIPHPQNPRKDLGDLTELVESIKAKGILQNLTVVDNKDGTYTCVIGHRRTEGAKLAGLAEVPCIIAEMSEKEQLSTMLLENMQRSDLTPYEQAQGFQMMMDLGATAEEVAKDTGFSKSTVHRRIKLLELNQNTLKEKSEEGATLFDFVKLEKIKDPDLKNEVLQYLGTRNFEYQYQEALKRERRMQYRKQIIDRLSVFAVESTREELNEKKFVDSFNLYVSEDTGTEINIPEDADKVAYYYCASDYTVELRRDTSEEERDQQEKKAEDEKQMKNLIRAQTDALTEKYQTLFGLRYAFIKKLGGSKRNLEKATAVISAYASYALVGLLHGKEQTGESGYCWRDDSLDGDMLLSLLDLKAGECEELEEMHIRKAVEENPVQALLYILYCQYDSSTRQLHSWNGEYIGSLELEFLYRFLLELGYTMSEEEEQILNGTHELYRKVEKAA